MNSIHIKPQVYVPRYKYNHDFGTCPIIDLIITFIDREMTNKTRQTLKDNDPFLMNTLSGVARKELYLLQNKRV